MSCARCEKPGGTARAWCVDCERDYDTWVRQHATDIIGAVLGGAVVVMVFAMLLPALGAGVVVSAGGAFAGFGTILAATRLNRRRRRRQFLAGTLPRAYLAPPK